ncbi:MAG: hypothetical protein ACLFVC_07200 [Opitutales bacterium]
MRASYHQRLLAVLAVLFVPTAGWSEFETFTNGEGHRLEAKLLEMKDDGRVVAIRLRDGREMDATLSAFSRKDRDRIRKWWEEELARQSLLKPRHRLEMTVKMNRKAKSDRYSSWYSNSDQKTKSFFPELIVTNDELDAFEGNEVRLVLVAEDRRYEDQLLVVSATTFKDEKFPDRGKSFLEGEPFQLKHYEYNNTYSTGYNYEYGYDYDGYVVVVKNADGAVTHTKASKTKYLSNMEALMKCKAGEVYDADLNRKLNVAPNSYFVQ